MQYLLVAALAILGASAEAVRLRRGTGPVTEVRQELRLKRAWTGDISDADPAAEQPHLARELDRTRSPFKGETFWDEDRITASPLDSVARNSPLAVAAAGGRDRVRGESSMESLERQRFDADPENSERTLEMPDGRVKQPDFFGKAPTERGLGDEGRQRWDLAEAKKALRSTETAPWAPEKIVPWRPDAALVQAVTQKWTREKGGASEGEAAEEDPTGGHKNFVAPCPLDSVLHPETCQTFITGQHPAVPDPVPCPAIQTHCGPGSGSPMMSLTCNGSCCPVCWAPDHVIAMDRHTSISDADVIPPHPAAPAHCAGVKCFTPLCLPGYTVGHTPGDCCSSCRPGR